MLNDLEFNLFLIRHGESEVNVNPDLMGQLPTTALTANGVRQALKLSDRFKKEGQQFDFIYSSSYARAFNTARIATEYETQLTDIIVVDDLREYNAGEWTGQSRKEILSLPTTSRMSALNHCFLPPAGESLHQVQRRATNWLEDTILYNKEMHNFFESKGGRLNLAVFSHGMTIKTILQYIMGFDRSFTWKIDIANTSISTVSFGKEGWKLHTINDYSHLT